MTDGKIMTMALAVLLAGGLGGCDLVLPPPAEPDPPYSKQTIEQLDKCQKSINKAGRRFTSASLDEFEACLGKVLVPQLQLESHIIDAAQFDERLADARASCAKNYGHITSASDGLIDAIVSACGPVEGEVLGPNDPLQFVALLDEIDGPVYTIEELAGFICGTKAFAADTLVGLQFPRKCYILKALGPEFGETDEAEEFCWPLIPLNPLCEVPDSGPD